jgi:hypothetical protein
MAMSGQYSHRVQVKAFDRRSDMRYGAVLAKAKEIAGNDWDGWQEGFALVVAFRRPEHATELRGWIASSGWSRLLDRSAPTPE